MSAAPCICRACISRGIFQACRHLLQGRPEIAADILAQLMAQLVWDALPADGSAPPKCEATR